MASDLLSSPALPVNHNHWPACLARSGLKPGSHDFYPRFWRIGSWPQEVMSSYFHNHQPTWPSTERALLTQRLPGPTHRTLPPDSGSWVLSPTQGLVRAFPPLSASLTLDTHPAWTKLELYCQVAWLPAQTSGVGCKFLLSTLVFMSCPSGPTLFPGTLTSRAFIRVCVCFSCVGFEMISLNKVWTEIDFLSLFRVVCFVIWFF